MIKRQRLLQGLGLALTIASVQPALSQNTNIITGGDNKTIITAVPFLTITPDSRAGSMGDVGVATSPDANSAFWNPGKLNFIDKPYGASVSYTPWLRKLASDVHLTNISGYYKLGKQQAVSANFTYFNLGSLQFTDVNGNNVAQFNPAEMSLYATYSRALSENFGVGASLRWIHSNLAGNFTNSTGTQAQPANVAAVDLGAFYKINLDGTGLPSDLALGATIANLGPKISYSNNGQQDFIPTTLKIGTAYTAEVDEYNKFTLALDATKLLVPTPVNGRMPADVPLFTGMVNSLYQAPGGMSEKLSEVMIGIGAEYWYDNLFAVRGGYFHEAQDKGNRRYFTAGIGLRYQAFGIDVGYVVATDVSHPLNETLRFSLHFDIAAEKAQKVKEESVTDAP